MFTFRPTGPGDVTDQFVRRELIPALASRPGLLAVYAARGSAEDGDERIVVTVWDGDIDAAAATADELGQPFEFELGDVVGEPSVEWYRLAFALDFERQEPTQILRIFRGTVLAGRLAEYLEEARSGTIADAAAERGPHALYLCAVPPDSFVTVSAWAGWDRIQAATGGNIREPIATKHSHLLERGTATHYEIVPNTMAGHPELGSAFDPGPGGASARPPAELAVTEQP